MAWTITFVDWGETISLELGNTKKTFFFPRSRETWENLTIPWEVPPENTLTYTPLDDVVSPPVP